MARTDPRPHYGTKRRQRRDGYIDIYDPTHPLARRDGYVFEHRQVAWNAGVLTDPELQVHHRNECRDDNRLENLEVKSAAVHALEHAEARGHVTNQYGTFVVKDRADRVSAPKYDRPCAGCPGVVPVILRRDALYCSSNCRLATFKRRQRLAFTSG